MTKVKVRIKAINPVVVGNGLNMIEITGYDATNKRGFKKRAFETKQDGNPTAIATTLKDAKPGDWFEFTLDDSTFQNPSMATKVSGPPPASSSGEPGIPGKFKKGEFRSVPELNRDVALNAALKFIEITKSAKSKIVSSDQVTKLAEKFYIFLTQGGNLAAKPSPQLQPETQPEEQRQLHPGGDDIPVDNDDDDVPF